MSESPVSLGQRLAELAQLQPEAPAVSSPERTITYGELHRRSNRIARGLLASGAKFGDLVTIGLPNDIGFVEAAWAVWKIGATPQPVSWRLPKVELDAIVELAATPLVIAKAGQPSARPRLDIDDLLALSDDESDFDYPVPPVMKAPTSGGSTGRPKLILSGQPGVSNAGVPGYGPWRMTAESISVMPAPLYHNGPFTMMLGCLSLGAHAVLLPRFEPEAVLAAIDRHKATWIYMVPTMMGRIWHLPEEAKAKYDLSSLQTLWHLAAPCPAWLKEAFIHWVGPDVVMELYAGTESQAITIITGREWLEHRGSVGKVVAGEMRAFDDAGAELPPGQTGEIYMRWPAGGPPTYRYLGATPRTLPGGWESLGDLGWFDDEGYLYLADRRTDMILVGGSNVYPAEIEAALEEHPLVQSSAVIGIPDDDLGARIHAIVQGKPGLTEETLRAYLKDRLVTYKQPRSYEFVEEPLRDDAGKVRRSALREARLSA